MVKLKARRELRYNSRMLQVGDTFEATPVDAKYFLGDESAEEVVEERRKTARSAPNADAPAPAKGEPAPDDDMTRDEMVELAKKRGIELPPGYVRKDQLAELLKSGEESSD